MIMKRWAWRVQAEGVFHFPDDWDEEQVIQAGGQYLGSGVSFSASLMDEEVHVSSNLKLIKENDLIKPATKLGKLDGGKLNGA